MPNEIVEGIKSRGWHVVENVLTPEECAGYIELLESMHARYSNEYAFSSKTKAVHGAGEVKIVHNLHNKHADFLKLIFHPTVLEVAKTCLSEGSYKDSEPFQVALTQARGLVGPQPAQQIHIDSYIPGLDRMLVLQAGWALTEFVAGNGSTQFVPNSQHRKEFAENGKAYDSVDISAPAGSLLLFNGSVWHGSSAKTDEGTRWAIFNRYSRWFMKPSFDHTRNTPASIREKLTDEQSRILGFHYRPPVDEFTRVTRISDEPEYEDAYSLP